MKKAISAHKKSRGRPATGQDKSIATRFPDETLRQIEAWSSAQPQEVSRSEAIRRLVELGLVASVPTAKAASKLAWRKKTVERWAERETDLGWRQRFDSLLRAAVHGGTQPQALEKEVLDLFGIKWKSK